jgi:protein required for attachment to host cells
MLINEAAERKEFDRLILVAPPKTLGDLRANLSQRASGLVSGELDRDLVNTPVSKLEDHLADFL